MLAAATWIADHAEELGGIPGQLAVAGWSAGANVAAVTAQQAKLAGGILARAFLQGELLW